jgi:uncharacterized membrane protein YccC
MIGAAELFWIATGWPNGALAITWAAIVVILFARQADQAYASALSFAVGACLAWVFAALFEFALLPRVDSFAAFSVIIGVYLIPAAALMTQSWQRFAFMAMTSTFIPFLAPANPQIYDTINFYNAGLAIALGSSVAALSFRLIPPLSPAFRTRRLLTLTLRDLRHLSTSVAPSTLEHWQCRCHDRLTALPDAASPLQRAQLLAAVSVGIAVVQLRQPSVASCTGLPPGAQLVRSYAVGSGAAGGQDDFRRPPTWSRPSDAMA